jgi:hypothetical protein
VTFINKPWENPLDSSDYALGKATFFATKSLNEQGCYQVSLDAAESDQPEGQNRTMTLHCAKTSRRFAIMVLDVDASTNEILQYPR